ncbi:MAG: hypothetical protein AAFU71_13930 [Cyanobacteria bacterium J06632_22]
MTYYANKSSRLLAVSIGLSLIGLGVFGSSAHAFRYNLDFNDVDANTFNSNAANDYKNGQSAIDDWSDWGVNISGINYRQYGEKGGTGNAADVDASLRLYDTEGRGGQDSDLETGSGYGTTGQGNALIIQKHGNRNSANPNDDANGGEIHMDFDTNIDFEGFTLIDVELEESHDKNGRNGSKGVNVFGYDASGAEILKIDVDYLLAEFYGQNGFSKNLEKNPSNDPDYKPSFSFEGVTITQVGDELRNNSVFQFDIDPNHENAQGLNKVVFQYPDISGAVSGVRWSESTPDEPEPTRVPEPSALAGLVMVGAYGARKYRQRRADKLAAAMGLGNEVGPKFS